MAIPQAELNCASFPYYEGSADEFIYRDTFSISAAFLEEISPRTAKPVQTIGFLVVHVLRMRRARAGQPKLIIAGHLPRCAILFDFPGRLEPPVGFPNFRNVPAFPDPGLPLPLPPPPNMSSVLSFVFCFALRPTLPPKPNFASRFDLDTEERGLPSLDIAA